MRCFLASLLLPVFCGLAGTPAAAACLGVSPPTKEIRIKNNSTTDTIFPVISIGKYDPGNPNSADLWMQAQCGIDSIDSYSRRFNTTKVYRAYINLQSQGNVATAGLPPGATVRITVPFWTALKKLFSPQLVGLQPDQFIDWWNSARIYFLDNKAALDSALLDGFPVDTDFGTGVPNQVKPTCSVETVPPTNCVIVFKSHTIDPRGNVPFQLQEYTFASAEGPVPGGTLPVGKPFKIEAQWVNYNVSSLDSVYLPVAMGPILAGQNPEGPTTYLGDGLDIPTFNGRLKTFSNNGAGWPFFIPVYFTTVSNLPNPAQWPPLEGGGPPCSFIIPFTNAISPIAPYLLPKIPGTANLLIESYRKVFLQLENRFGTIVPPLLSSQPSNFASVPNYNQSRCDAPRVPDFTDPPGLGTTGKAVVDLWTKCTTGQISNPTCDQIKQVNQFFLNNFKQGCPSAGTPDLPAVIFAVYGWVPIRSPLYPQAGQTQCGGPALATTQGSPSYSTTFVTYCELQYNYLTTSLPQELIFNPYTQLIHKTLESTAYAFSIDDAQAFRHLVAPGVIITIGGAAGLDNTTPSPSPDSSNFRQFCRQS